MEGELFRLHKDIRMNKPLLSRADKGFDKPYRILAWLNTLNRFSHNVFERLYHMDFMSSMVQHLGVYVFLLIFPTP